MLKNVDGRIRTYEGSVKFDVLNYKDREMKRLSFIRGSYGLDLGKENIREAHIRLKTKYYSYVAQVVVNEKTGGSFYRHCTLTKDSEQNEITWYKVEYAYENSEQYFYNFYLVTSNHEIVELESIC